MLTDSHTHLYLEEFSTEGDFEGNVAAVDRAIEAGVGRMMLPNVDLSTIGPMKELARRRPGVLDIAIGLHPTEVRSDWRDALNVIEAEAATGAYKAIGEIGIDYYWDKDFTSEQVEAFDRQCRLAEELGLPVLIHCREGLSTVLELFDSLGKVPRGVFHSFGGTADDVEAIRRRGDFYFGINGIVTFKNSRLRDVLPAIGLDRILLETDSPYLAPVPMRGRRNESAYIVHIAEYVARVFGVTVDEVARITSSNYDTLINKVK